MRKNVSPAVAAAAILFVVVIAAFFAYRTYAAPPADQGMAISGKADLTKITPDAIEAARKGLEEARKARTGK